MFKKIKKHRLSLFLLAMVMMLSVYYVLMPQGDVDAPVVSDPSGVTRYEDFAKIRLVVSEERNEAIKTFEQKILDKAVTVALVEEYTNEILEITKLTEKEVYLETVIMDLGYEDSLVIIEDNVLTINVLGETFTALEYIEVAKLAKEEFGKDVLVVVNLITTES